MASVEQVLRCRFEETWCALSDMFSLLTLNVDSEQSFYRLCAVTELDMKQVHNLCEKKKRKRCGYL